MIRFYSPPCPWVLGIIITSIPNTRGKLHNDCFLSQVRTEDHILEVPTQGKVETGMNSCSMRHFHRGDAERSDTQNFLGYTASL